MMGQYIALHAAKSWDESGKDFIEYQTEIAVPGDKQSPHSVIFAVCRLAGVIDDPLAPILDIYDQIQWFFGPYGWFLDSFVMLKEPVPCKGAQKLWGFDDKPDVLRQVRQQWKISKENQHAQNRNG